MIVTTDLPDSGARTHQDKGAYRLIMAPLKRLMDGRLAKIGSS